MRHDIDPIVSANASDGASSLYACVRTPELPDAAAAVARDFSPRLQRHGQGCVVLDISGLGRLLGDPPTIGAELARAVLALYLDCDPQRYLPSPPATRIAIAPTQTAALLLSLAQPAVTVVVDDIAASVAGISLDVLREWLAERQGVTVQRTPRQKTTERLSRLWESYEKAFEAFRRWGIHTLGALAALPAAALSARMGQQGIALQRSACGIDTEPLIPDADVQRFLEHVALEWPIDGLEPLSFVFARLLDPLSVALERADRGAVAIHATLRLVDKTTHVRLLQLPAPMRDPRVLRTLLVLDLESHPPSAAIDEITLEVDPAPGRVLQYSLLERARPSAETLATLTARLSALVGESRSGSAVLRDSHGPDAFVMQRFAPDDRDGRAPFATVPSRSMSATTPSALDVLMLRRFRPPVAVRVTVERGRPARVAIDRRGMPGGIVEQRAGPWRSSGEWWAKEERRWNRDEWEVAFSDGSICRLFHDRDSGQWFLDGVLD